jgi:hypothetical protein
VKKKESFDDYTTHRGVVRCVCTCGYLIAAYVEWFRFFCLCDIVG